MGFVARTMPQLNILSIGFALRILLGIGLLIFMIQNTGEVFVDMIRDAFADMDYLLQCAGKG